MDHPEEEQLLNGLQQCQKQWLKIRIDDRQQMEVIRKENASLQENLEFERNTNEQLLRELSNQVDVTNQLSGDRQNLTSRIDEAEAQIRQLLAEKEATRAKLDETKAQLLAEKEAIQAELEAARVVADEQIRAAYLNGQTESYNQKVGPVLHLATTAREMMIKTAGALDQLVIERNKLSEQALLKPILAEESYVPIDIDLQVPVPVGIYTVDGMLRFITELAEDYLEYCRGNATYCCPKCTMQFKTRVFLFRHFVIMHSDFTSELMIRGGCSCNEFNLQMQQNTKEILAANPWPNVPAAQATRSSTMASLAGDFTSPDPFTDPDDDLFGIITGMGDLRSPAEEMAVENNNSNA